MRRTRTQTGRDGFGGEKYCQEIAFPGSIFWDCLFLGVLKRGKVQHFFSALDFFQHSLLEEIVQALGACIQALVS